MPSLRRGGESQLPLHYVGPCTWALSPLESSSFQKPFMVLMMHDSASMTSLASPDLIFTAFRTLALRSPPPSSGFTLSKGSAQRPSHPHTPLPHFVRPKSSSLAYRLAFVICLQHNIAISRSCTAAERKLGQYVKSARSCAEKFERSLRMTCTMIKDQVHVNA